MFGDGGVGAVLVNSGVQKSAKRIFAVFRNSKIRSLVLTDFYTPMLRFLLGC